MADLEEDMALAWELNISDLYGLPSIAINESSSKL